MKIVLKKALSISGKSIKELDLDLEKLSGNDLIDSEKEVMISDNTPFVMDFNRSFLITIASKAAGLPSEALRGLNIRDFTKITNEVQRFLTGTGSDETNTAETSKTQSEIS